MFQFRLEQSRPLQSRKAFFGCLRIFSVALPVLSALLSLSPLPGISGTLSATTPTVPAHPLQLEQQVFPQGVLYSITLPANSSNRLQLGVSPMLAGIESVEWRNAVPNTKPLFIINGGFFDPQNRQTTSYLVQRGTVTGDPRQNAQLMDNPKLAPYLPAILNRSEFRIYRCTPSSQGNPINAFDIRYDITPHQTAVPNNCHLETAAGAGPSLLPFLTDETEGFIARNAQGRIIRDPIGVFSKNARSVVGITTNGDVIFMMGAQTTPNPSDDTRNKIRSGFSLPDMAAHLKAKGAVKAMALDGGSSSGFVYADRAVYGKFNADGSPVKRPVKSVWMIVPPSASERTR